MRRTHFVLMVACGALYGGTAAPADSCATGTIQECFDQIRDAKAAKDLEAAPKEAGENVDHELAASTSTPDAFGARVASTVNDYASRFGGLVQSTDVSDDGTAVNFYFNPVHSYGFRLQFAATVQKPAVYEPVEQQLLASGTTADLETLKKGLGDFDDTLVVASWALQNKSIGRSADPFLPWIEDLSVESLLRLRQELAVIERSGRELAAGVTTIYKKHHSDELQQPLELSLGDFDEADRREIVRFITKLVDANAAFDAARGGDNIKQFAALLDSQPQLDASAGYERRADAVGPSNWFVRFSYEYGFRNAVARRAWADLRACFHGEPVKLGRSLNANDEARLGDLAQCFDDATDVDTKNLKRALRVSVSGEYQGTSSTTLDLSSVGLSVPIERDHAASLKFGLGWYVHFNPKAQDTGRLDVTAEAFDYGADTRQNRVVATATYTMRISETAFVPIGVSWANKTEFVGDSTKRLSAHLGVTYRFAPKN